MKRLRRLDIAQKMGVHGVTVTRWKTSGRIPEDIVCYMPNTICWYIWEDVFEEWLRKWGEEVKAANHC